MKILSISATNFGSYELLNFSPQKGLTLIAGPTGSGKSTLCDLIPWGLFGRTAKDGQVDEVVRWGSKLTTVEIILAVKGEDIIIVRSRGKGKNDLFFYEPGQDEPTRGKDLLDTQTQLNHYLGCDSEAFRMASYFHEFSPTSSFFSAPAKIRRSIIEQIVDMSLAKRLKEGLTGYNKEIKQEKKELEEQARGFKVLISTKETIIKSLTLKQDVWSEANDVKVAELTIANRNFEKDKRKKIAELEDQFFEFEGCRNLALEDIKKEEAELSNRLTALSPSAERLAEIEERLVHLNALHERCPTCGSGMTSTEQVSLLKEKGILSSQKAEHSQVVRQLSTLKSLHKIKTKELNPFADKLQAANEAVNSYKEKIEQKLMEVNPYRKEIIIQTSAVGAHKLQLKEIEEQLSYLRDDEQDADTILAVADEFRLELVKNTVSELEDETNKFLSTYYDSEFRVTFLPVEGDKIEVEIYKDGNLCSYSQLSKGQRQLLKLCFGLTVMRVTSDRNGIDSRLVFLDEALDGLDDELKLKSFYLLKSLENRYDSVYVVEHNEALKAMFDQTLTVALIDGKSVLEKA